MRIYSDFYKSPKKIQPKKNFSHSSVTKLQKNMKWNKMHMTHYEEITIY